MINADELSSLGRIVSSRRARVGDNNIPPDDLPSIAITSRQASDESAADLLRNATIWLVVFTIILAVAMMALLGVSGDALSFEGAAQFVAAALLSSAVLRQRGRMSRLALCLGAQGLVALSGIAGGIICLMGLQLGFPTVDRALKAADQALGVGGLPVVEWVSRAPPGLQQLIGASYTSTLGLLLLSLFIRSLAGDAKEVWRATFCFSSSLLLTSLISIVTPAKGLGLWIPDDVLSRFSGEPARYFFPTFDRFYRGHETVVHLGSIDAVVSFPSFHIVMGLIAVALWRKNIWGLMVGGALFVVMAIGTIPFGGHYTIDLIGGLLVWAATFGISSALIRWRVTQKPHACRADGRASTDSRRLMSDG